MAVGSGRECERLHPPLIDNSAVADDMDRSAMDAQSFDHVGMVKHHEVRGGTLGEVRNDLD